MGSLTEHDSLKGYIRDIPDFPKPGVVFKDITPLLADTRAFRYTIDALAARYESAGVNKVAGIEARGFIVAAPLAYRLDAGFLPIRKQGKLPGDVEAQAYQLEYGTDHLEMLPDAVAPGERVLIVDDVLATGGTAVAAAGLVERCGGEVCGIGTIMELTFLNGRARLDGYDVFTLISY
jgi:adenine phosphoribosyltransferase